MRNAKYEPGENNSSGFLLYNGEVIVFKYLRG